MISATFIVRCDGCYEQKGPTFCSEAHANDWIDDRDEDYEEYGSFSDNVIRRSEILHKIGGKLICKRCTEIEIERSRNKWTV